MASDATAAGVGFVVIGVGLALLGAYIRVARRPDLLANYDGTTSPEYAAVHAGNVIALTGALTAAYGAALAYWRLPEVSVIVFTLVVFVLALFAAARAQGY